MLLHLLPVETHDRRVHRALIKMQLLDKHRRPGLRPPVVTDSSRLRQRLLIPPAFHPQRHHVQGQPLWLRPRSAVAPCLTHTDIRHQPHSRRHHRPKHASIFPTIGDISRRCLDVNPRQCQSRATRNMSRPGRPRHRAICTRARYRIGERMKLCCGRGVTLIESVRTVLA